MFYLKCDVDKREVSREEALRFCQKKYIKYIETSYYQQNDIDEAFEMIVKEVIESNFIEGMKSKLMNDELPKSRNKGCVIL